MFTYALALLAALPIHALASDVLSSSGVSTCQNNPTIKVQTLNVAYDRTNRSLAFDVAGVSTVSQKVTATLYVTAYGRQIYTNSFSPCDIGMTQMCPIPATNFSSHGTQTIPEEYANQIPSIAFSIPDLDGQVKLQITKAGTNESVACITTSVTNGKTMNIPAVKYVGIGIAGAALILSGVAAVMSGSHPGASTSSPTFGEVFGWFQGMAMNGMMSVNYPQVYQSFATNFGFSTGLVSWDSMQNTIDGFRASTGGNLTHASYPYLKNATLIFPSGASTGTQTSLKRRALDALAILARDGTTVSIDGQSTTVGDSGSASNGNTTTNGENQHLVSNFQAYVEQLTIPQANTFMTLLLVFALVVGALIVLVLLGKVILELWRLARPLPHSLESWRQRYWWRLAKAIVNLILLLYSVWTMYCIYQFTIGDSWAAKLLAGVTLALFTAILAGFIIRIYYKARQFKKVEGDVSKLYEDKEIWIKYSLFYDGFKRSYWWIFIPFIFYAFARGAIIAGANGHGLIQCIGHLIVDGIVLLALIFFRPYQLRSGNIINIIIQIVRVLSVACILVFVEELGVDQTTKTITGLALIILQCVLTGLLAILIVVNALIYCIRENPHRRRRKQAEKMYADYPSDDALLMHPVPETGAYKPFTDRRGAYDAVPTVDAPPAYHSRNLSNTSYQSVSTFHSRDHSGDHLLPSAAGMGRAGHGRSLSLDREPTLPAIGHAR